MYKSWILWLIAASIAGAALGDVLVTKDGQRIETRGPWTVEKGVVEFTNVKGTFLSIRLTEIDLEASEEATERSAQAREKLHDEEMDEEPETNPMAAVILQSRAEEKTESVREFTHEEIAGQSLRQFRRDVAKVLAGVDLLKRRYDLSKPEGIHRASAYLQIIASTLRELLLRPLPKRRKALEEKREVEAVADYLERLAKLADEDPGRAIRMLNEDGPIQLTTSARGDPGE